MAKITKKEVAEAMSTLLSYRNSKGEITNRILEEDKFWKRRHWEIVKNDNNDAPPASSWLFNSIANKHADAMDNFPELKCLPREKQDEEGAKRLSSILPVLFERTSFRKVYSRNWWYKLIHGCSVYGVFWDSSLNGGLGDIHIEKVDLLNIFWEPGVTDIQKSRNVFIIKEVATEDLKREYPKISFSGGGELRVEKYETDSSDNNEKKSTVVDWYYKKIENGKPVLHFCKFAEGEVLFATENEKKKYPNGWYDHGKYPLIFDVLYPVEEMPVGFGIVSIIKNAQLYIDKLDEAIMNNAMRTSKPRFFAKLNAGINEYEFLDWNKPIIHVEGDVDENRLRQLSVNPLNGYVQNFREHKIDELKETSANRDFAQGGTTGGVTSGAAIATLQEAGNKTSRDMINESYEAIREIGELVIELLRQFYDEKRCFRINGESSTVEYEEFDNKIIGKKSLGVVDGKELFGEPIFDIVVKAQKHSPYSTLSQNETAMNLYNAGFFAPQNAQMSLAALQLMDFDGKKEAEEYIKSGQTLENQLKMLMEENEKLKQVINKAAQEEAEGTAMPYGNDLMKQ